MSCAAAPAARATTPKALQRQVAKANVCAELCCDSLNQKALHRTLIDATFVRLVPVLLLRCVIAINQVRDSETSWSAPSLGTVSPTTRCATDIVADTDTDTNTETDTDTDLNTETDTDTNTDTGTDTDKY